MTDECRELDAYLYEASEWTDELERHSASCELCGPAIVAHRSLGETLGSIEMPKARPGFEARLRYRIHSSAPLSSVTRWVLMIYGLLSLIVAIGLISRFDLEQVGVGVYVGAGVMFLSVSVGLLAVWAGRPRRVLTRFALHLSRTATP